MVVGRGFLVNASTCTSIQGKGLLQTLKKVWSGGPLSALIGGATEGAAAEALLSSLYSSLPFSPLPLLPHSSLFYNSHLLYKIFY